MAKRNIGCCLIGMMGAGKTTVGRKLARRLNCEFVDLDHEIEARTGVSIPTIFEIEGEAGFRQREARVLAELTKSGGRVVATGGGVVLDPRNRAAMQRAGLVVYLHAPPELLYARTRHDRNRPLLQVADPLRRITELVERRDPLYREVADVVIEAGGDPAGVLALIETEMGKKCEN
ncbi:MAG: shikimate kinase [Zoogloea oleivorans]|jgi:shikimate kinase|uniref:shikimate kinase n=1 Tax=Zoogloea oleivorans TaxID=1552750 RepID=UPI002A35F209|nr:shikimate kinase [Zoogloea oleivorans]MDY0038248.1 shikimate kinase [Zoogloea oleivorans]